MLKHMEKLAELKRAKLLALSLLLIAAAIFITTLALPPSPWVGALKAISEAAMVGALADWFAVVALFRRIPLPFVARHTAIIPRNKDRIADNLGRFVEEKFLDTPSLVALIRRYQPALMLGNWFSQPENARRVGQHLLQVMSGFLELTDDARIQRLLRRAVHKAIDKVDLTQTSAMMLEGLTRDNRHQKLLDSLINQLIALLQRDSSRAFIARGTPVQIGVWVDGAMPNRAETVRGYVQAMHLAWLQEMAGRQSSPQRDTSLISIETRYRYNPDVKSLPAIVPAVIPLLLMMIPAMLSALSVVREKELGSIINLYVTPTTRSEFLLGKQLPYIVLGMFNFFLLCALSVFVFGVAHKGSFLTLTLAALLYVTIATGLGLLISTFMKSQIAAIFGTAIITLIPATQFSGMIDPVASLEGPGRWIGQIYPTSHFLTIARGTFSKALNISDLWGSFIPLLIAVPLVLGLSVLLLKKQEG